MLIFLYYSGKVVLPSGSKKFNWVWLRGLIILYISKFDSKTISSSKKWGERYCITKFDTKLIVVPEKIWNTHHHLPGVASCLDFYSVASCLWRVISCGELSGSRYMSWVNWISFKQVLFFLCLCFYDLQFMFNGIKK